MLLNAAFLVGHGTLRSLVMGGRADTPTADELKELRTLTLQALREGAFGLSAGLAYAPGVFAQNDELLALLRVAAEQEGLLTVHGRAYTWVSPFYKPMIVGTPHNVRSTRELIGLAAQAGVRLELSHLIFVGRRTWRTYRTSLRDIEQAADQGQDLAFDAFPYTVGNSTINVVFPKWFLDGFERKVNDPAALRQLKREINLLTMTLGMGYRDIQLLVGGTQELEPLEGMNFSAIAQRLNMPEFDAYMHVARLSNGEARILLGTYSGDGEHEETLRAVLAHPLCSFVTDTILSSRGKHNPASFGNYPRILGRYSRDLGLFSLEEAVRRMTSFPAERIGLQGVGRIAEGMWADLALFDAKAVADNTTPERADAPPSGIRSVLVSGEVAARDGKVVSTKRYGRVLRR
jgi:N-acyl-D-amino-acid deacylase